MKLYIFLLLLFTCLSREVLFTYKTSPDTNYSGYRVNYDDAIYLKTNYPDWFQNNLINLKDRSIWFANDTYIYYTGHSGSFIVPTKLLQSLNDFEIKFTVKWNSERNMIVNINDHRAT